MRGSAFGSLLEDFDRAARLLDLDPGLRQILARPKRQIVVSCPVEMDNGDVEVFSGYRVQYNIALGPALGGIRLHPGVTLDDMTARAARMTWRCAVAQVPFGGSQGGLVCDPSRMSRREIERLTRRYVAEIADAIGPDRDIAAPGLNADGQVMAWVMDTYSMRMATMATAVAVGKPLEIGGLAGRPGAAGRGVAIAARQAARSVGFALPGARVAVLGFDGVCEEAAVVLERMGARVIAAADARGGVYEPRGLDVGALLEHRRQSRTVDGFAGGGPLGIGDVLGLEADILLAGTAASPVTEAAAGSVRAPLVVEASVGATTAEACRVLQERGLLVVPEILSGAGRATAAHLEWEQNRRGDSWSEADVHQRLDARMGAAFEAVFGAARKYETDLRTAATVVAIARVAAATRVRGMYA
ncbi:MAG TPA: Glu/Leu/Phe/Val dehydrogenase [Vicinamibacterales bacterium]|nr:Glu/Leu/Phe/Val dehydrogenase [Vicinamibacterales bacterium]